MAGFILRKLGYTLLVLLGVAALLSVLFIALPDPARLAQGQRSDKASREAAARDFGTDKNAWTQFAMYLNDLSPLSIHENTDENKARYHYIRLLPAGSQVVVLKKPYLRRSYQSRKPVTDIISGAFTGTLVLALAAMAFATALGLLLGIMAALRQNTFLDRFILFISTAGVSLPSFFAAIIISWLFGHLLAEYTGLSMTGSLRDYDPFTGPVTRWENLILPAFALGIRPLAIITQLTRSTMLEILQQDYIRTARAKGLPERTVIFKHALRNALNPVITSVSGWFASLLAGAFFVEYIFNWKGIGKVTIDALEKSDLPVIMGCTLFVACLFSVINLLVDISYAWLDPRVKIS